MHLLKSSLEVIKVANKKTKDIIQKILELREWYDLTSILGNKWALFYFLIGGRERGKSYSVTDFYCRQFVKRNRPFYWLRLSETSKKKLLMNNAEKLVDPDLRRKYNLDLTTNGDNVYQVTRRSNPDSQGRTKILEKKLMCRVMSLATFYNDKGSGLFDKDFLNDPKMYYNICLDEMNREKNERNSFDIVYAFCNQLENLVRSTKQRCRIICIGNTLEEASDLLCAFNFLPENFGRFYLKKKRAVIDYIPNNEAYQKRREGTIADILMPSASTFTNKINTDNTLVTKERLTSPHYVIKFSKESSDWFTVWNNGIIAPWHGEKKRVVAMRPYLDELYSSEQMAQIIQQFDYRAFYYKNLITFKLFQKNINLLKPRGN